MDCVFVWFTRKKVLEKMVLETNSVVPWLHENSLCSFQHENRFDRFIELLWSSLSLRNIDPSEKLPCGVNKLIISESISTGSSFTWREILVLGQHSFAFVYLRWTSLLFFVDYSS